MRCFAAIAVTACAFVVCSDPAVAADFPARPVRLVVPFPPGGGTDLVARMLGERLAEGLRVPVVIDNRPGAAGTLGAQTIAQSAPDGHSLLLATATFAMAAAVHRQLPYDAVRDFTGVGLAASQPLVLVVHPGLAAANVGELVALARARPGALNYASGGAGGINHLAAELLAVSAGVKLTHVPYRGAGPALTALMAGESQLMIATVGSCLGQMRSGRLRALGLARSRRAAILPDLPTLQEAGLAGYEVDNWYGILAPRGTPAAIIDRIHREIAAALQSSELQSRFASQAFEPMTSSPGALTAHVRAEVEKWRRVAAAAGVSLAD